MWRMPENEKEAFRRINGGPFRATEFAKYLGKTDFSCNACQVLRHGIFVIPGETSWSCLRCAFCCKNTRHILLPPDFPKKPNGECAWLDEKAGGCACHENKNPICKTFPFGTIKDPELHPHPLLLIDKRCLGVNHGEIITDGIYNELIIMALAQCQVQEAFGGQDQEGDSNGCEDRGDIRETP